MKRLYVFAAALALSIAVKAVAATSFSVSYACPTALADAQWYAFQPASAGFINGRITACAVSTPAGSNKCKESTISGMAVTGATTLSSLATLLLTQWQTDNCH